MELAPLASEQKKDKIASITVGCTTEKEKLTRVETRDLPDLPDHIIGHAFWVENQDLKQSAYWAFEKDQPDGPI
jgi:hypothetical protein